MKAIKIFALIAFSLFLVGYNKSFNTVDESSPFHVKNTQENSNEANFWMVQWVRDLNQLVANQPWGNPPWVQIPHPPPLFPDSSTGGALDC